MTLRPLSPDAGEPVPPSLRLRTLEPSAFVLRLPELIAVYVAAMRYPDGVASARAALWQEHSRRAGFACVVAVDSDDRIRGLAYGYTGRSGQWWFSEVERGLGSKDSPWLADYLELTELHVRPDSQGAGIGQSLLTALLTGRPEKAVLLSTPEGTNRAWRLYRRMGFVDVLRHYRFTGDPRPFGVLGRVLPLDASSPRATVGP
jgi:ribosomal protein S18 acetylase RimI-like enzyme